MRQRRVVVTPGMGPRIMMTRGHRVAASYQARRRRSIARRSSPSQAEDANPAGLYPAPRGREPHELAGVRAGRGEPDYDFVPLGDEVFDGLTDIGKRAVDHRDDPSKVVEGLGRVAVRNEVGCEQFVQQGQIPPVQRLLPLAAKDSFVRVRRHG